MKAKANIQNNVVLSEQMISSQKKDQNKSFSVSTLNNSETELPDFLNFKDFMIDDDPKQQEYNISQNVTSADFKGPGIDSKYKSISTQNITANICNNTFQNNQFNHYFASSAYLPSTYCGTYINPYPVYYVPSYVQPIPMVAMPNFQAAPKLPKKKKKIQNLMEISITKSNNLLKYIRENDLNKIKNRLCSSEGSDFFQNLIKEASTEEISEFIKCIEPFMQDIMTNHHGNYLFQVLFSNVNYYQRKQIWNMLKPNIIYYSQTDYSTYCIQVLIEHSSELDEENNIMLLFKEDFMKLACNKQGNHIIKSLLKSFKSNALKILTSFLLKNFQELIRNVYGISIIKKFIEYVYENKLKSFKLKIKEIISSSYKSIISNEYAHYAILHIIDIWGIKSCDFIIRKSKDLELLVFKYNSRIIYKIIDLLSHVSSIILFYFRRLNKNFVWNISKRLISYKQF